MSALLLNQAIVRKRIADESQLITDGIAMLQNSKMLTNRLWTSRLYILKILRMNIVYIAY